MEKDPAVRNKGGTAFPILKDLPLSPACPGTVTFEGQAGGASQLF